MAEELHEIEHRWLMHTINAPQFRQRVAALQSGSTRKRISRKNLATIHLSLPPLVEQRAIVAKIEALFSELDQGVAQLEAVRQQLTRYRQSVLKAAFEGKLTADWRAEHDDLHTAADLLKQIREERELRFQQRLDEWERAVDEWEAAGGKDSGQKKPRKPAKPKQLLPMTENELAELPELPEGWAWCRLTTIADLGTGTTPNRSTVAFWEGGTIPWIASAAVNNEFCDGASDHVTETGQQSGRLTVYPPGTLLLALYGEGKTRGKVTELRIHATINQALAAICLEGVAGQCRGFVKRLLQRNYTSMRERSAGGVQPNLNLGLVSMFRIPLASVDEQAEIMNEIDARLSVIDQVEQAVGVGLKQAEALRQSILKKAFEGRLLSEAELAAVRTDPAYESADKLLERIRAEREDTAAKKPKRGRKPKTTKPKRAIKLPTGERYRQAAVAAYAVKRLGNQPTFGRVQQMKYLYLVPHAIEQASHIHAQRQAAGPLDPAIHKIEGLAKRNGWFSVRKSGKRYIYSAGTKINEACTVAEGVFGDAKARVDWLLDQFVKFDTERAELLATTFAVWNDFLIDGHEPSESEIATGVHGWHADKATKFPADRVGRCIAWMKEHDFVPTGKGPGTEPIGGEA